MNPEVQPQAESQSEPTQQQPSPEEVRARIAAIRQQQWDSMVVSERLRIARQRGLIAKDNLNEKDIAAAIEQVTLDGDEIEYAKDKNGNPRLALDKHGFLAFPKQHGRRRPRMTKKQQSIKAAAVSIFRRLFKEHGAQLEQATKKEGNEFSGVPESDLPKIGARASMQGLRYVRRELAAARRRNRAQQKFSRKVNRGIVPGNQRRRFV